MAGRSTRTKIRFQVEKACNDVDESIEHLAKLDIVQDGRSDFIEETLPQIVTMLEAVKQLLWEWRSRL